MEGIIMKSSNLELGVLFINPIWHGGPEMFLTTMLKRLGGKSWNLVTFIINLWSIKKSIFASLGYMLLP